MSIKVSILLEILGADIKHTLYKLGLVLLFLWPGITILGLGIFVYYFSPYGVLFVLFAVVINGIYVYFLFYLDELRIRYNEKVEQSEKISEEF